jgi:hypothetical protein
MSQLWGSKSRCLKGLLLIEVSFRVGGCSITNARLRVALCLLCDILFGSNPLIDSPRRQSAGRQAALRSFPQLISNQPGKDSVSGMTQVLRKASGLCSDLSSRPFRTRMSTQQTGFQSVPHQITRTRNWRRIFLHSHVHRVRHSVLQSTRGPDE